MLELALKLGVTFLNLDKDYGIKEFMRTALQYLKDYGGYDIPEHFYDKISKLPKTDTPPQIYSFNTQIFSTSLDEILISKKNPNTQDLMILDNLKYASKLECTIVSNRVVLAKILSINTLNFSFTPHNVASIRIFAQLAKEKQKHLKTSQKRFILHSLQGFDEALVMDDFATHKAFWKGVEKQIKPTQKKYEKFTKAREFFRKLKNNDFAKSNNAIIEKSLKNDDIISKMAALKSPQYALRNITKVLKNNPNLDFTPQLKKLKPTLKQLVELYLHLQSPSGISKIKTKFFKHDTQPLSVEKRELAAVVIKNLIAQKCKKIAQIYAKTRENLTPLKACKRPLDELKSVALPVQNDCFFDAPLNAGYVSRGSKIPFSQLGIAEDFCAFVAWKRKDGAVGNLDLDLSACYIGEMGVSHINYTRLNDEKNGIKHSGDYTSCRAFEDGLITAEAINFKALTSGSAQIVLNSFNGVDLNAYDVYVGFANRHLSKDKQQIAENLGQKFSAAFLKSKDKNHSFLQLEKACWAAKITSAQAGYLHLMSLDFAAQTALLTGVQMSGRLFASSNSSQSTMAMVQSYYSRFASVSVLDLLELLEKTLGDESTQLLEILQIDEKFSKNLGVSKNFKFDLNSDSKSDSKPYKKASYNPYALKEFLDYIINSR